MNTMAELISTLPQVGTVSWLCVRPERRLPVRVVNAFEIDESTGIVGDHFSGKPGSKRQVTLIQQEHIEAVEKFLQKKVCPSLLRRNIVVSGINLLAMKDREFRIGSAVLFGTANCPPCSRMEENLGLGGYNAMRGHGGITARVVSSGVVKLGDTVVPTSK